MMKQIVRYLCSEEFISSFIDSLYTDDQGKMLQTIQLIGELENYWGNDKSAFMETFSRLLNDSRSYKSFLYDIQVEVGFVDNPLDYTKAINRTNVLHMINQNAYWKVLAIATKKCIGNNKKGIDWSKLESSAKAISPYSDGPYTIFSNVFNGDCTCYNIANIPHLGLMLHKKHHYKQHRKQKKQISRVYKRARKIMLAYKLYVPTEGYFSSQRHMLPETFIKFIRAEYFN